MDYLYLKGTGLKVSRMCIGTMTYGGQLNEEDAIRLTHNAFDRGVNFIDTANSYTERRSEGIVGKALKGRRDKVFLSTKVGYPIGTGANMSGLSRHHIIEQVEISLKLLDTDYIDIYYMHVPDIYTPIEETLEAYSTLVRSGKIRYIGVSNFAAWQLCEALYKSELKHFIAPSISQMVYNMLTRGLAQEFIPFIEKYKLGLVIYNPLAGGILSGKYKRGMPVKNTRFTLFDEYKDRYWTDDNFDAIEDLSKISSKMGISLIDLAMRWCLSQDAVDSILVGFSKEEQLIQNIDIIEKGEKLEKDILLECDKVWQNISGTRFKYNR